MSHIICQRSIDQVDARSETADWVSRNTEHRLTDNEARCIDVLVGIGRLYNLSLIEGGWADAVCGTCKPEPSLDDLDEDAPRLAPVELHDGVTVRLRSDLGTYDSAELTRLVLAAHEHAVRVEISAVMYLAGVGDGYFADTDEHPTYPQACLEIRLSARQREGSLYERHPTIEEAITRGTVAP